MSVSRTGDGLTGGFRDRLFQLRQDRGWSQSDLARRVWGSVEDARGYTVAKNRDRISAYEGGKAIPERSNLDAIAQALGVPVEELAPDLVMANPRIAGGQPAAFEMKVMAGGDRAHVRVDAILPLSVAVQMVQLLNETRGALGA